MPKKTAICKRVQKTTVFVPTNCYPERPVLTRGTVKQSNDCLYFGGFIVTEFKLSGITVIELKIGISGLEICVRRTFFVTVAIFLLHFWGFYDLMCVF